MVEFAALSVFRVRVPVQFEDMGRVFVLECRDLAGAGAFHLVPTQIFHADHVAVEGNRPIEVLDFDPSVRELHTNPVRYATTPGSIFLDDLAGAGRVGQSSRSEEHTSELQSLTKLVCR